MKRRRQKQKAIPDLAVLLNDPDFHFDPHIPSAIQTLLDMLPEGQFVGTSCVSSLQIMLGPPEEGPERPAFSFSEMQEAMAELEKKRLLVRFTALGSQPAFLVFAEPISASFLQAIQAHVEPNVLTLSMCPPPSPM